MNQTIHAHVNPSLFEFQKRSWKYVRLEMIFSRFFFPIDVFEVAFDSTNRHFDAKAPGKFARIGNKKRY